MKFISLFIIFCIISSKAFSQAPRKTLANWKLIWSDEFNYNGLPDSSKWNYDVGGKGWGNNELQYYIEADSANVFVHGGVLCIKAVNNQKGNNAYTPGLWPAIWMLPTDWKYGEWPKSGEIDIMESV